MNWWSNHVGEDMRCGLYPWRSFSGLRGLMSRMAVPLKACLCLTAHLAPHVLLIKAPSFCCITAPFICKAVVWSQDTLTRNQP